MQTLYLVMAVTAMLAGQHIPYAFPGNTVAGMMAVLLSLIGGAVVGVMASK